MKTLATFKIEKPISQNRIFAGKERRYKTNDYKNWIDRNLLLNRKNIVREDCSKKFFRIEYSFSRERFFKNGSFAKWDMHNYLKAIDDLLSKMINGFDDSRICLSNCEKSGQGENECIVTVYEVWILNLKDDN